MLDNLLGVRYNGNKMINLANLRLTEISQLFLLILISFCLGLKILKILKIKTHSFLEELIFSTGLGLGCVSYLVLCLGLSGLLYDWVFYLIFVLLAGIFYCEILYLLRKFLVKINLNPFSLICSFFIALTLILAIILVLVPTVTFDALVYHLAVPEIYVKHHKIIYLPYNCFSNYTFNTEMLFTLGLLLNGDLLAKLIHFLFGILSGLSIYSLARRYFTPKVAFLSVLSFCSMPLAIFVATSAFNDFAITFYEILAVYAFLVWYKEKTYGWLLLSGLTCGLSIGVKYFGGFGFGILVLSILIGKWRQDGILKAIKTTIIFGVFALIPVVPWLIKNLIFTGNPVFPLLYDTFGGKNWSQIHQSRYLHEMTRYSAGEHLLLKPFIFFWNICFKWGGMDTGVKIPVGPIFIISLPFLLKLKKLDFNLKYLLTFCGIFFLFWSYVCAVDRFSLPCFVLLCVVIGYVISKFKYLYLLLAICLLWNLFNVSKTVYKNSYLMCLKKDGCEKFLLKKSIIKDYYDVISYINQHLPKESKILFIGEVRSYYCQQDKLVSTQFDTNIILELIRKSKNKKDLIDNLKKSGVTHLLYNEIGSQWLSKYFDYFSFQNKEEKRLYHEFMQNHLKLIYCQGAISVFQL
ncbi:MAG: glycosyltransferase family 39 protein [bacterium]